jgi:hypothetical protein
VGDAGKRHGKGVTSGMGRWLILVVACFVAIAATATTSIATAFENDSIFIDNKAVRIDAQVRFDSLRSMDSQRKNERKSWEIFSLDVQTYLGVGGRNPEDRWHQWTGEHDRSWAITLDFGPRRRSNLTLNPVMRVSGILGLSGISLLGIDSGLFPDSLIGFSQAGPDAGLQMVTYERFSIGVETDTIPIGTSRSSVYMPFLGSRFTIQNNRFEASLDAGAIRVPAHTERLLLNPPTLTNPAFVLGDEVRAGWRPILSWQVGLQLPGSRWNFDANGRVILGYQQNHWLGIGVGYML